MSSKVGLSVFLVALPCLALSGQEKAVDDPELAFWGNSARARVGAAAMIVAAQDPFLIAALRLQAKSPHIWNESDFIQDEPLALDPVWLKRIRDDMFPPKLNKDLVTEIKASEWAYRRIYHDALLKSFQTPLEVLKKAADKNPQAGWKQLMNDPAGYRGEIIAVKGKLRRLEQERAPADLRGHFEFIYDAWIQTEGSTRPMVFTFSVLPDAFKPYVNTTLAEPAPVMAYGYFILRYKYENKEGEELTTPLVIGQTLVAGKAEEVSQGISAPVQVFIVLAGIVVFVVVLMVALHRWYKREDKRIMDRVNQLRAAQMDRTLEEVRGEGLFQDHPLEESPVNPVVERNGQTEAPAGQPPDSAHKGSE